MPAHMLSFGRRGDYSLVSEMLARTDHSRRIVRGTIVGLNMKLRSPLGSTGPAYLILRKAAKA